MEASLIVSIISLFVSVIVIGVPFYHKFIEKETKIALIACDGIIRDDTIRIVVTYVNRNWLNAVITNSSISLHHSESPNKLMKINYEYSCKSFTQIVMTEKMHASTELIYSLSELKKGDWEGADVYVNVEYIDSQGRKLSDSHKIGTLCMSGINTKMVLIESLTHELRGRHIVMSMNL